MNCNLSIVGILHVQIPDHRQRPLSNSAADIQMSIRLEREHHKRLLHIPLHISVMVRRHNNGTQRSVSVKANRQEVIVILKHITHHECPHHRSAKRRRRDRTCSVSGPRLIHQSSSRHGKAANLIVSRDPANHIVI